MGSVTTASWQPCCVPLTIMLLLLFLLQGQYSPPPPKEALCLQEQEGMAWRHPLPVFWNLHLALS